MKSRLIGLALLTATFSAMAQSPSIAVPSQFASAHTIFLAFGGDAPLSFRSKESSEMLYSSAYKALSSLGRYRLTTTPAEADLSTIISIEAGYTDVNKRTYDIIRLAVFDTKTHALLWDIDEPLEYAYRKGNFQKNIDESMTKIVTDLNSLAAGKLP